MFAEFVNNVKNVLSTLLFEGKKTVGVFGASGSGKTVVCLSIIKSMMDKVIVSGKKPSLLIVSYEESTSGLINVMTEIGYDFKTIVFCHVFHQLTDKSYLNYDYVFFDTVGRNELQMCLNEFHKNNSSSTIVFSNPLHNVSYRKVYDEEEIINQIKADMKLHAIGRNDTATAIMVSRAGTTVVLKQLEGFSNTAKRVATLN